jgi:hypothetical protein
VEKVKTTQIFSIKFFFENILKIKTSVPASFLTRLRPHFFSQHPGAEHQLQAAEDLAQVSGDRSAAAPR